MTTHRVKSWAHFFDAIKEGKKLHDLRKLDRDYKVGDILILERYDNINGEYTGEELEVQITYITSNKTPCAFSSSALDRDYGIFSIRNITKDIKITVDGSTPDPRTMQIIKKSIEGGKLSINEVRKFAGGGPIGHGGAYTVGEKSSSSILMNPTSPNPNAEYYQNR